MSLPSHPILLPGCQSKAATEFLQTLSRTPRWAHHPTCKCFDGHLIRLGRSAYCLGCLCFLCGASAASVTLVLLWISNPSWLAQIHVWQAQAAGTALYLPTLAQLLIQWKPYKMASRTLLGVAVVVLFSSALLLLPRSLAGLILRFIFIMIFCGVYKVTQRARSKYSRSPCTRCKHAAFPFCRDNLARHLPAFRQLKLRATPEDQPFAQFAESLFNCDEGSNVINSTTLLAGAHAQRVPVPTFVGASS